MHDAIASVRGDPWLMGLRPPALDAARDKPGTGVYESDFSGFEGLRRLDAGSIPASAWHG